MYLVKRDKTDIDFIKENFSDFDNMYFYEKLDIEKQEFYKLKNEFLLFKSKEFKEEQKKRYRGLDTLKEYKNSYYYKLLLFCQSLPGEVYGSVMPYFDKYGVRKLKQMYKLSKTINNENEN